MMRTLVNPAAAERFSGELSRLLFWVHHASGPIALGVLTIAVAAAILGYLVSALVWRFGRATGGGIGAGRRELITVN